MSVIHKFRGDDDTFDWDGVSKESYPNDRARQVSKRDLIDAGDGSKNFGIRYFEIAPGGHTSLDEHAHDHGIVVVRGRGTVLLGDKKHDIGFGDAIYISPYEKHQFQNDFDEPLGILCVIPPKEKNP